MYKQILKEIVQIDSQNPGGDSEKMIQYIRQCAERFNFSYEIIRPNSKKSNIIVKIDGINRKRIVINGHVDTKPYGSLDDWIYNPLEAKEIGEKLFGVGSSDMKGGVASMLTLLFYIGENNIKPKWDLEFHFVDDEENNSGYGMRYLIDHNKLAKHYDLAIVCEPTENSIVLNSLGNTWKRISIKGKQAHAGHYFEGISANEVLVKVLRELKDKTDLLKFYDDVFPYFPNVNIGIIKGGNHPGTVNYKSEAVIDIRVSQEEDKELILNILKELLNRTNVSYEIENYLPSMYSWKYNNLKTDFSELLVNRLKEDFYKVSNEEMKSNLFFGGSDAGHYAAKLNTPVFIFGPGSLKQAHQPNEWINLDEVKTHFECLKKLLLEDEND
ncbi:acetylornithine deacetylase/succinyl-diaminopimelate desuccinylase family protein [Bacillus mesophilus]|uniref:M20 family metallopeptidase n=1 Tax=Bacillus mesophilus TaxID=1808955 RepID=A0A6M0Q9P6_9BACI|nr:ArgE/DapE family deacylase [Bacillus mesophilus]MBM7662282.1 acetylornithine deacetylase/succinyl-diaminopimelate desuccinylase family protein [Bacillus mesophilus]NEY73084.1 M20 family metallopeptidase [Bacillus mesophilus]